MNIDKVENIIFADIDHKDYPDYSNDYIESAEIDGTPLTDEELESLRDNYPNWFYEKLFDYIF